MCFEGRFIDSVNEFFQWYPCFIVSVLYFWGFHVFKASVLLREKKRDG